MRLVTRWTAIWAWTSLVTGQDLAFTKPVKLDPSQHALNSKVEVAWTTPFENTNLEIWQGPRADGSFAVESLLKNASQDTTTYTWKAKPLDNMNFAPPFHFRLQKGDGDNLCDGCVADSLPLSVANVGVNDNSVLTSTANPNSGNHGLSGQSKLMIGLSIGIAAAVVTAFVTLVCCTQRDKSPRSAQRRARKRPRTPISMMFRGYLDERRQSKAPPVDRVQQIV
ncbi:hypothetical protein CKM354_001180300 [Cercospora kikuchii]|uniref:Ser-Thr-rich glycosyl-phosphatidyl-inositol-anchored membrane family protein n=1 Tax=Cercospora kikuchii TaxID=84275 RepID=A0A9P3FIE6_9PEZI|nr:uncharacterized protein CKM354_001180300 [Cercospora kikuchii]GIZ48753.1 hypothetical protein CKM354_001180300 [Cercospora kikuchii]